jgi:hypothetical protein
VSVDVEAMRRLLEYCAVVWVDGGGSSVDAEDDVTAMLDEIVSLRERVAELEAIIEGLDDVIHRRVRPISELWDDDDGDAAPS